MRSELVKSMLSMVTPRLAGIGLPSFCQVMKTGWSPDITTQGMKTRWPMEKRGNSNGWMVGGTGDNTQKLIFILHVYISESSQANKRVQNKQQVYIWWLSPLIGSHYSPFSLYHLVQNIGISCCDFTGTWEIFYYSQRWTAEFSLIMHQHYAQKILSYCLLLSGDTVAIVRTKCFEKLMI